MDNRFEITEVADGIRLCSYKTDRFKTGRLSFNIAVPLLKDASCNAILPYILNRSCKEYRTYRELNKKLASLYGATLTPSVMKNGETHVLRLSMTMIDNKFAFDNEDIILSCADLLFGLVFNPNADENKFDEDEVTREKRLMVERIQGEMNDKRVYALRRLEQIMCENEAFSSNAYGTEDGINKLTPESIYDAYRNVLETGHILVNAVGNVDTAKIAELLKRYIVKSGIKRENLTKLHTEVVTTAGDPKHVTEELPVNQGKLVMGFRVGTTEDTASKEYPELKIMTDIFGGGTYSRLFMNVREKMSLCYYCSARFYRHKGIVIVQSGIENENAETAEKEILNQLESLKNGEVGKEDISASLLSMKDTLSSACDTPEDIDAWSAAQITDDKFETPEETIDRLMRVTEDDVIKMAKRMTLDTVYMLKGTEEK